MRLLFAALLSVFAVTSTVGTAKADSIQDVISSQLDAFQADDFATAFTFASPMIKRLFGTPERFGSMVREGYPMVWRPADVAFIGQESRGGRVYQKIRIQDAQGAYHGLEYEMIETENGWQINGVRFIQMPDLSA
jgi:hypothetical protein